MKDTEMRMKIRTRMEPWTRRWMGIGMRMRLKMWMGMVMEIGMRMMLRMGSALPFLQRWRWRPRRCDCNKEAAAMKLFPPP